MNTHTRTHAHAQRAANLYGIYYLLLCSRQISAIVETVREQQCSGSAHFCSSTAATPRLAALVEGRIRNAPQKKLWNVVLEVMKSWKWMLEF